MDFLLEIVTPERTAYTDKVRDVIVPTPNGTIGVLPKHVGLFTVLGEGEIKISTGTKELFLAIGGGFMEVSHQKVSILVSRAVHADELHERDRIRERERRGACCSPGGSAALDPGDESHSPPQEGPGILPQCELD